MKKTRAMTAGHSNRSSVERDRDQKDSSRPSSSKKPKSSSKDNRDLALSTPHTVKSYSTNTYSNGLGKSNGINSPLAEQLQ